MHAVSPIAGFRFLPSRVDLGMLEDIGCRVDYSQIPQFDDVFYGANPVKERYLSIYKGKKQPVGLWYFDIKKYVWGAIRGNHVKYVPPIKPQNIRYVSGGIEIPDDADIRIARLVLFTICSRLIRLELWANREKISGFDSNSLLPENAMSYLR